MIEPSAPPPLQDNWIKKNQRTEGRRGYVPELPLRLQSGREGNCIVESQTECLVSLVTALVAEQVVL